MKILVTGGNGFLGSRIVDRLTKAGHEVTVFARSVNPQSSIRNPQFVAGNLADADQVSAAIAGHDTVFHVAAKAGVWGRRRDYFDTNVTGTRNVVAACGVHGVKSLIYTSTPSVVFSAASLEGVNEDTPYATRFLTHYAETKCIAEKEVLAANGIGALRTVALRPHLIWGTGDPHLVPRVLARARAGRLKRVGDGTNKVDITHVEDAADAHILALEKLGGTGLQTRAEHGSGAPCHGKAYFISSEAVLLWEWINALLSRMGLPPVTRSVPRGLAYKIGATFEFLYGLFGIASDPPMTRFVAENLATSHWFDISRARKDFGYEPKRFGVAALDDYLQTEKAHASH
ncbi:sterol-4alpha-carboxylate 3-dehydrogenase (decarboxylating) [Planctomycetaceae bacterium]|nr:sterol-4alpha-carboxylate 3-dehydrogenase (decarboxylating) [Planctomycetaceae bacterium]